MQSNIVETIYQQLIAAGVPLEDRQGDLWVPVNDTTRRIIEPHASRVRTFTHPRDRTPWYDIPFGNVPFWKERKHRRDRGRWAAVVAARKIARNKGDS